MKTVLIVEDEAELRSEMGVLLEFEGYKILEANDGAEALSLIRKTPPDAILSDVVMPVMDGFDLLDTLQQTPTTQHIPFIFISARATEQDIEDGLKKGARAYYTKPLDIEQFLVELEAMFD